MSDWITETVSDDAGFRTSLKATSLRRVAGAQDLLVFDNPAFGRVLMLDGAIQVATGDEFVYHEMMAHVPLFAHGAAESVLIIGGGDGGLAREVLRHPVGAVTLVEIDRGVVDLCREHMPEVSAGAFDDPRLDLVIADGAAFVAEAEPRYDVVIVDAPDPVGAGAALFTRSFYEGCRGALRPGGVFASQSGMPFLTPDWLGGQADNLRAAFGEVAFFLTTVPSYTGGPMLHAFAGPDEAPRATMETLAERQRALGLTTRYWSPEVHVAAFALPPFVMRLLEPANA